MTLNRHLLEWKQLLSYRFPHLSLPQVNGLATWSFGMVMTKSSSLTRVSHLIAKINQEKENTVRQRLKEWYKEGEAKAKKGNKRVSLEVTECFASLLRWIVDVLPPTTQELPIALDATCLGQNFTVLSINVLIAGSGIPVAWKIVKATQKGSWKPYWQELLSSLKEIVPTDWQVIVAADRGLYAHWLYQEIVNNGWHPFLRINHQGLYQISGSSSWHPLATVVDSTARSWSGQVSCFKTNTIECTLLARWDQGYSDPWLIVTDLNPTETNIDWYGFRSWIECSYRDIKSDGWQWQRTRLTSPQRAERHWLAMAVALLWTISLGTDSEKPLSGSEHGEIIEKNFTISRTTPPVYRQLSYFLDGLLTIVARLLNGQSLTFGRLEPSSFKCLSYLPVSDSS
ncbi:transposase [Moorena producens]|uniref:transposase n=1 Tax=Moorena producens TaxID=1155739 RepID=UPI003C780118